MTTEKMLMFSILFCRKDGADLQKYMKSATDFMSKTCDVVDGPGNNHILTDGSLAIVASNLGVNWTLVALNLGLTQSRIEQLHMDHPHVS